jgi:hypothetical protein
MQWYRKKLISKLQNRRFELITEVKGKAKVTPKQAYVALRGPGG